MSRQYNVYTVTGSEDGLLGIYSSKKKAMARAIEYVMLSGADGYKIDDKSSDYITWVEADGEYEFTRAEVTTEVVR